MFIFGWGRQTTKRIGIAFRNHCNHCNNDDYWVLAKITTWFTLFFVPVLPYETKYFLSCPVCQYGLVLNHDQLREIQPIAELNQLLVDGNITEEEHQSRMALLNGANEAVQVPVKPKALTSKASEQGFCPNCGGEVNPELKFCGNCGHRLAATKKVRA